MKALWMLLGALSIVGVISYAASLYLLVKHMRGFWLRFVLASIFFYITVGQAMTVSYISGFKISNWWIFALRALVALTGPLLLLTLMGLFKNGHHNKKG